MWAVAEMEILLNGKTAVVEEGARLQDAAALAGKGRDVITVLDGFQTNENVPLTASCRVVVLRKDEIPGPAEALELLCARNSPGVTEKLQKAHVAVAGLGGLGSNVATELARVGVGHLHLIDFDTVDATNLNRQLYFLRDLGQYKTEALRRQISEITPCCSVAIDTVRVTEDNVESLFAGDDYVCECFDKPDAKAVLVNGILEKCPEKFLVAASGMAGTGSSNVITTRHVMGRFYLCGDGISGARPGQGLMAPRVTVCAAHEANMVLRLILGEKDV